MEGRDLSLDAPVADGTSTHLEFTPADGDPQDEELARVEEEAIVNRRVDEAMSHLDPRERHIVEARVMGDGKETLRDLGQHFGFSRERARQLEIRALEKLRRELQPLADEIGYPAQGRGGVRVAEASEQERVGGTAPTAGDRRGAVRFTPRRRTPTCGRRRTARTPAGRA